MDTNLAGRGPHIVLCPDAFSKCGYLAGLARDSKRPVVYVDADMMYSGYVRAGMIERPDHTLVRRPDLAGWGAELSGIIGMVSAAPHLVILDTLNGLGAMWGGPAGARLAGHSTMLLAALSGKAGTRVVAAAIARRGPDGWEMAPGGRLVPGSGSLYVLKKGDPVPLNDARRRGSKRRYETRLGGKLY